jgi:hypothetical protein
MSVSVFKVSGFQVNISHGPFKTYGSDYYLLHDGFLVDLFFTLKMEAIYSSEMSVDFQRNIRRYIQEDSSS